MSLATRIAQEFNDVRNHLPVSTPYNLLQGSLSVSNEVITNGFSTTLYTGNGGTQTVVTNVDMSTQWGNDASERFGGLSWIKSRSAATNNYFVDTVRGATKDIYSNATTAETTEATGLTSFNSTGFNLGVLAGMNTNGATYASWNFQTTHRRTGVTNHGKAFTEHYNPFTGFTMIKYEGSGLAGHEIPHVLGRKVSFAAIKNLSAGSDWLTQYRENNYMYLNLTNAETSANTVITNINDNSITLGVSTTCNTLNQQYIIYGWANSYFDESNKLIGNYEIGVYQGTGASGNKITTKGKPAWLMIKRLDSTGGWYIQDNQRLYSNSSMNYLLPNTSAVEGLNSLIYIESNSFRIDNAASTEYNASGGQYLYMVVYDNDSCSGKSKYPKATDSSQLQINALIPFANGVDGNGAKNTILSKNETITGLTLTAGKNYVYGKNDGSYGVKPHRPRYLSTDLVRTYAGESPDYYDVKSNKWFNTDAGSELVTNGKFDSGVTTGWSTDAGITLSVSNGALLNTSAISSSGYTYQSITTVIGKTYRFKAYINNVNMYQYGLLINDSSNTLFTETITATGAKTYDITFVAQSTTTNIKFFRNSSAGSQTLIIDNVTCFQTDITPTSEITDSRNYLDAIVYADHNGQVEYVEQLPKTQYVDEIKANEFKGKNACTAWVNFNGTTTPPTISDSYNVSSVIRTATGVFDIYFEKPMDNINYSPTYGANGNTVGYAGTYTKWLNKITVWGALNNSTFYNVSECSVHIDGGKN